MAADIVTALNDYVDAEALYKETVKEMTAIERKKTTIVHDFVKGSSQSFPYTAGNIHISGIQYTPEDEATLKEDEEILKERARRTKETKMLVEHYMLRIPPRMQRIIRYKIFDGNTWEEVATRMGRKATGESVKKEFQRFTGQQENL